VLCEALGISNDRLSTLIELWNIVSSSLSVGSIGRKSEAKTFSCTANVDTTNSGGIDVSVRLKVKSPSKPETNSRPIFRKHNSTFQEEDTDVIDLGSPSPVRQRDERWNFHRSPMKTPRVEKYDFFGANSSPSFEVYDEEAYDYPVEPESDNFNYSSELSSSIYTSPQKRESLALLKKPSPLKLGSVSPGGKIDPNKFPVGKFVGKVTNHGTTGEFDGFEYPHSKMMLNVSIIFINHYCAHSICIVELYANVKVLIC